MTTSAIFEPPLLHPEQLSAKKPWERQEGETARWHMRFRLFLNLGPKRTINAAFAAEHKDKQRKSRTKTGPEWYAAAKRYQWEERAYAWDREQDEQKAALMRRIATRSAYVSRPFRITQLNSLAETLSRELEKGQESGMFLAIAKQMQALMHDIRDEMDAWAITIDASCDAAAFDALEQKRERMDELELEREEIAEAELDAKIEKYFRQKEMAEEMRRRRLAYEQQSSEQGS